MKYFKWILILLALFFFVLLPQKMYLFHSKKEWSSNERETLVKAAVTALTTRDIPISSILVYKNKIIGTGYNTVVKDTNIGGHAEINAISNAMKNIEDSSLKYLDKDSLYLITTFEPCLMCKGAIIEQGIHHVYFVKEKEATHWFKNNAKLLRYEWLKTQTKENTLQDSIFRLHPDYKKRAQQQ